MFAPTTYACLRWTLSFISHNCVMWLCQRAELCLPVQLHMQLHVHILPELQQLTLPRACSITFQLALLRTCRSSSLSSPNAVHAVCSKRTQSPLCRVAPDGVHFYLCDLNLHHKAAMRTVMMTPAAVPRAHLPLSTQGGRLALQVHR
jgi:hypothetical protein